MAVPRHSGELQPGTRLPGRAAARVAAAWVAAVVAPLCLCLGAHAGEEAEVEPIHSYVNKAGRTVYVNGLERVPQAHRKRAKALDLSHISLNRQLAADLDQALDQQVDSLLSSGFCANARAGAAQAWYTTLWQRHSLLVVVAAVLLLFLLASPYLVRTIGAPRWGKLVMVVLPLLGFIAVVGSAAIKTSDALAELNAAADACGQEQFAELPDTPAGRAKRLHLMDGLRQKVAGAHGQHLVDLDRTLRRETQ